MDRRVLVSVNPTKRTLPCSSPRPALRSRRPWRSGAPGRSHRGPREPARGRGDPSAGASAIARDAASPRSCRGRGCRPWSSGRLSRAALRPGPIHSSLPPSLYSQALSKKLMPASIASCTGRRHPRRTGHRAEMMSADADDRDCSPVRPNGFRGIRRASIVMASGAPRPPQSSERVTRPSCAGGLRARLRGIDAGQGRRRCGALRSLRVDCHVRSSCSRSILQLLGSGASQGPSPFYNISSTSLWEGSTGNPCGKRAFGLSYLRDTLYGS